jgi:hypothetical protein
MSYRGRYEREHYVKREIRRDIHSKLMELSKREGLGLQELLAKLIKVYEGCGQPTSDFTVKLHWDQLWFLIRIGSDWGVIKISLNLVAS